jgi:hypothetical protein
MVILQKTFVEGTSILSGTWIEMGDMGGGNVCIRNRMIVGD